MTFFEIQLRYRDISLSHKRVSEMKYNIIIKGIAFIYLLICIIKLLKDLNIEYIFYSAHMQSTVFVHGRATTRSSCVTATWCKNILNANKLQFKSK